MGSVRKDIKDSLVIGFALFSMFFGAGNVIFPPYLGLGCGREWVLGFLCYYLADIGLALLAMFLVNLRGILSVAERFYQAFVIRRRADA